MKGYLKNPEATEEAFAGGWFHSGDLGVLHPDGYIQLKDRSKDIIISGGENISSIEVEDVLYKHPAVAAAAVVGRPDAKWGETPVRLRRAQARRCRADGGGHHRLLPRASRRTTRCRATSCSARCPRPSPARSRNSCCGSRRRRCEGARGPPLPCHPRACPGLSRGSRFLLVHTLIKAQGGFSCSWANCLSLPHLRAHAATSLQR